MADAAPRRPERTAHVAVRSSGPRPPTVRWPISVGAPIPSALPASGAWRPGDHAGRPALRRRGPRPSLRARGRWAAPRAPSSPTRRSAPWPTTRSNAVLVCHALTGDSHAAGGLDPGHAAPGWWNGADPGRRRHRHSTGGSSCASTSSAAARASTGPASPHPDDGRPYGARFPVVSIRDMVRTQAAVADALGIRSLAIGHRRVDGRDAGPRVGRSCTPSGSVRSWCSPAARRRRPSRSAGGRPVGASSAWTRRGTTATTTTPRPARAPTKGCRWPAWSARSRSAPTTSSPTGSGASWSSRSTASRCGSGSRSSATSSTTATSSSVASTPTPTCCSPRPWTSTTSAAAGAASSRRFRRLRAPVLDHRRQQRHPLSRLPVPPDRRPRASRPAARAGYRELDQPARPRRLPASSTRPSPT